MNPLQREEIRLIDEATRRADAARRSLRFTLQLVVVNVLFTLTPLVPHADRFFGPLSARLALSIASPALGVVLVSVWLHRHGGSESRVYRVSEAAESFLLYANVLAFIFVSGKAFSVFYILPPFTAAYWATTKPFQRVLYGASIGVSHGLLALAFLSNADARASAVAAAMGIATYVTFESLARGTRMNLRFEAERNLVGAELHEALLERERERIGRALREGVGREIARLAEDLEAETDGSLGGVLQDLGSLTTATKNRDVPRTIAELARQLDDKCRPLCEQVTYESKTSGDPDASIEPSASLAFVRVAQELVRNAVVHGRARNVRLALALGASSVALEISDDGAGLSAGVHDGATGGLKNARRWLEDLGGTMELASAGRDVGASFRALVPRCSRG